MAHDILSRSGEYKYLFTDSKDKVEIETVGQLFDIDQIISKVRSIINSPDFLSLICDTEFESDVPNAKLSRRMCFAHMGTPYFSYMGTLCGLPHVEVIGSEADWFKLYHTILALKEFGPSDNKSGHENHMLECANIISNIIYYCFGTKTENFEQLYKSKEEFFSDIFHYGDNPKCESGHDGRIVSGWLRVFYGDSLKYTPSRDLYKYNTHSNYICMKYEEKMYCQVVSLAYSELDSERNTLIPHYGIVTYEITDHR